MHVTYFNIVLIITSHSPPNKKRGGGGEFWVGHEHVFHLDTFSTTWAEKSTWSHRCDDNHCKSLAIWFQFTTEWLHTFLYPCTGMGSIQLSLKFQFFEGPMGHFRDSSKFVEKIIYVSVPKEPSSSHQERQLGSDAPFYLETVYHIWFGVDCLVTKVAIHTFVYKCDSIGRETTGKRYHISESENLGERIQNWMWHGRKKIICKILWEQKLEKLWCAKATTWDIE